mgnify:CR=1 FL=1
MIYLTGMKKNQQQQQQHQNHFPSDTCNRILITWLICFSSELLFIPLKFNGYDDDIFLGNLYDIHFHSLLCYANPNLKFTIHNTQ